MGDYVSEVPAVKYQPQKNNEAGNHGLLPHCFRMLSEGRFLVLAVRVIHPAAGQYQRLV